MINFGNNDKISKEAAVAIVHRYRDLTDRACEKAIADIEAFPGEEMPSGYAIFVIMAMMGATADVADNTDGGGTMLDMGGTK